MSVCLNELEVIILYVHKIIEYFELSEVVSINSIKVSEQARG